MSDVTKRCIDCHWSRSEPFLSLGLRCAHPHSRRDVVDGALPFCSIVRRYQSCGEEARWFSQQAPRIPWWVRLIRSFSGQQP